MTNPFSETTNWTYKNNNWLETQTLDNGATATYTYNALGQVTRLLNQIGTTTISDFTSIAYDGAGNRTSVTASIRGATSLNGTTNYTYDSTNQLTQETSTRNGGFTNSFGYDSAGNPTSFKGVTKNYNSNNQRTGTGFSYTYDALYRLKTLKDGNNNATTDGYNNIELVSSITMHGGEVTQFTSYDNAGNLLQRIDGNNVTTNDFANQLKKATYYL